MGAVEIYFLQGRRSPCPRVAAASVNDPNTFNWRGTEVQWAVSFDALVKRPRCIAVDPGIDSPLMQV